MANRAGFGPPMRGPFNGRGNFLDVARMEQLAISCSLSRDHGQHHPENYAGMPCMKGKHSGQLSHEHRANQEQRYPLRLGETPQVRTIRITTQELQVEPSQVIHDDVPSEGSA